MSHALSYHVIGLMSGSSLDGLDVACCRINANEDETYNFEILETATIQYKPGFKQWLMDIHADINKNYSEESIQFGNFCAETINNFIRDFQIHHVDFIASHGHTMFHYPEKKITCQIGDGNTIAQRTGINVIYNFRQADVDAGGQGAPLVPIADENFFSGYDACLNIGGIANISVKINDNRIGFDICAANQLLNFCAGEMNLDYDADGNFARQGSIYKPLLDRLNGLHYFKESPPKSLDNNFIKSQLIPMLAENKLSVNDKLATATEHIAIQISYVITKQIHNQLLKKEAYKLLVTGGGTYNKYLIERIEKMGNIRIHLPSDDLIQYKEALAICLMGVLRLRNKANFLPSVTGAKYAVCGGEVAAI